MAVIELTKRRVWRFSRLTWYMYGMEDRFKLGNSVRNKTRIAGTMHLLNIY